MYSVYKIMFGDTLDSIANKTNTSVEELMNINSNIDMNVDSYIVVPANSNDSFFTYIVKSGDNLYQIAREYNISAQDLASINGIKINDYLYPNQQIMVPTDGTNIYVTKEGDTLDFVLDSFNTNYDTIKRQNKKIYLMPDQLIIFKEENF